MLFSLLVYIYYIAHCYVVVKIYSDLYFDYRPVNVALGSTMQGQIEIIIDF